MSHDLEIVVSIRPQHFLLEEFIALHNSLSISGQLGSETGNVIVYRRGGKTELVASFEVWGPSKVEPEDLEESVVSLVAAPRWMVEISVPAGGEGDDVPDAEALARYIAQRCKGSDLRPAGWSRRMAKADSKKSAYSSSKREDSTHQSRLVSSEKSSFSLYGQEFSAYPKRALP